MGGIYGIYTNVIHSYFTFKSCDNEVIIYQGVVIERSVKLQCTCTCKGRGKWWYNRYTCIYNYAYIQM